ncbi:hypothetical protein [Nannocystis pusilla]|uniref:hypothetical protein n=1 Tax=Nannocystis pusilla TaxID=889268 RepID=UPI003DA300E6
MLTKTKISRTTHLMVLALALPACTREASPAHDLVVFGDDLPESEAVVGSVIETLEGDDGASLTFIDLGDGDVGVMERRPAGRPSALAKARAEDATPLELYVAARGHDPAALTRLQLHHEQVAESSPRPLKIGPTESLAPPNLDEEGYHDLDGYCHSLAWGSQWSGDLGPLSAYDATDFYTQEDLAAPLYFAPGSTNNTQTWIGACVDHQGGGPYDDKTLTIQKLVSGTWSNVAGEAWYLDASTYNNTYTFYAFSLAGARYRGRLTVEWGGCETTGCSYVEPSFGWGLAWTPVPPIGGG